MCAAAEKGLNTGQDNGKEKDGEKIRKRMEME